MANPEDNAPAEGDATVDEIVSMIMELPEEVQAQIYDTLGTKISDASKIETESPEFEAEAQQDLARAFI